MSPAESSPELEAEFAETKLLQCYPQELPGAQHTLLHCHSYRSREDGSCSKALQGFAVRCTEFASGSELAVVGSPDVFGTAWKKVSGCDVIRSRQRPVNDGAAGAIGDRERIVGGQSGVQIRDVDCQCW